MKTKKINTKNIAILSLMTALTAVFCFVPISFGTVTLALMILPTLIIAQISDFKMTVAIGLIMGLMNYIAWFTTKAASPLAPIFQNPLVCILPRVLIGIVAFGIRKLFEKYICKPKYESDGENEVLTNKKSLIALDQVSMVTSTALGVVTNTFFVGMFTLIFFYNKEISSNVVINFEYILTWYGINFLIEVISFSIITPAITLALRASRLVPKPDYLNIK